MTWTLWRGEDLLGTVHERSLPKAAKGAPNTRREINAVLVPDPAHLPLPSVSQHIFGIPGSTSVREHIREPHVTRLGRQIGKSSGRTLGVWVVPREPATPSPTVPPERQLHLRDEDGRVVPTCHIGILEHRPHPSRPPSELPTLPEGAFIGGSVWLVHFTPDIDAPAT